MKNLIDKLEKNQNLTRAEWKELLENRTQESTEYLFQRARVVREKHYGKKVYIRGLIEISNFCKNDCYYCGIRRENKKASRYRLTKEDILHCCREGYGLGFRTFVLQGGEDLWYTDAYLEDTIQAIKREFPDCALTLSLGEKTRETYARYKGAGADRYLLRHETATEAHYEKLHPTEMKLEVRKQCLRDLKDLGFQTGSGIMVGSPYQSTEDVIEDLLFLQELKPEMIGIGPFIPHAESKFRDFEPGDIDFTLYLLGILRLLFPKVLLPATTALGTLDEDGREKGILAGANVIMPNLSPVEVRKKYLLYDNKLCTGDETAEALEHLKIKMKAIGYEIVTDRGDSLI